MSKSALAVLTAMLLLAPGLSSAPLCRQEWNDLATRGFLPEPDGSAFTGRAGSLQVRVDLDGFRFRSGGSPGQPELQLQLEGVAGGARLVAEGPLPGERHEFIGADPARWWTGRTAFRSLRIVDAYPGIDVLLELDSGGPRLRVELAPGADPRDAGFRWHGVESAVASEAGGLSFATALGTIELSSPRGPSGARWVDRGSGRMELRLPETDLQASTAANSDLLWSTYFGGPGGDALHDVATGRDGLVTVVGTAFHTFGAIETSVLVARFDLNGPTLLFTAEIGGHDFDYAEALAVDEVGRTYVGGSTFSDDFPLVNAIDPVSNDPYSGGGPRDAFLLLLAEDGATLEFSTFWGGSEENRILDLALAPSGDVVVVGETWSADFQTTAGAFMAQSSTATGDIDAFVSRFSKDGQQLLASTYVGGSDREEPAAVAVAANGDAVVAGQTTSLDFPVTPGAYDLQHADPQPPFFAVFDGYLFRLSADATRLEYATYFGGAGSETVVGLGLNYLEEPVVAGWTYAADFPVTPGVIQPGLLGESDGFLIRLDATASTLRSSTYLGGTGQNERLLAATFEASGIATLTGETYLTGGATFPTTEGSFHPAADGWSAFVSRVDPYGESLLYSTFFAGDSYGGPQAVASFADHSMITVGQTVSASFPTTPDALQSAPEGPSDGFLTVLGMLPLGVLRYGRGAPTCTGPVRVGPLSMPKSGDAGFGLYGTGAPPQARGWLASGLALSAPGTQIQGAPLLLDPNQIFRLSPVLADGNGYAEVPFDLGGLPAGVSHYHQLLWADPGTCAPPGTFHTSNVIEVTVQPESGP